MNNVSGSSSPGAAQLAEYMAAQLRSTGETADAFKTGLRNTIAQIDAGYRSTMFMYRVTFYLGVGLVLTAGYMALTTSERFFPLVFGSVGALDLLGFLIFKPAQQLQASRATLAQLQAAYFNWFIDITNWNSYLGDLGRRNAATFEERQEGVSATSRKHRSHDVTDR